MSFDVEEFVHYQVANAEVRRYPFPHFFVSPVFPEPYYAELIAKLPPTDWYSPIDDTDTVTVNQSSKRAYPERFITDLAIIEEREEQARAGTFWHGVSAWLTSDRFRTLILKKFRPDIAARFGEDATLATDIDARLVRDFTRYAIGPHTDSQRKLVSLLFYLPRGDEIRHLGTSIYAPLDPGFRCAGGPHYAFDKFKKVASMPFAPNSLFAFFKTDQSFHGVDQILDAGVERNLLLYNIYVAGVSRRPQGIRWPWRSRRSWTALKRA